MCEKRKTTEYYIDINDDKEDMRNNGCFHVTIANHLLIGSLKSGIVLLEKLPYRSYEAHFAFRFILS